MNPFEPGGKCCVMPRSIHYDEVREIDDVIDPLPRIQGCRSIVANDRVPLHSWMALGQMHQRVCRKTRSPPVDFIAPCDEPGDPRHRCLHHGQSVVGRRDFAPSRLLPGVIRDHQNHLIEIQGVAHVDGSHQMTHMRRIERATKKPDSGSSSHLCSLETDCFYPRGVKNPRLTCVNETHWTEELVTQ